MGFAIGISGLKAHWALNGIVMGLVVGSIFSYFLFMSLGARMLPVANFLMNGLFGLVIEFLTTVVCRQRALTPVAVRERIASA
jgi:multisubunit Na+/H+ antiporter MnhE subunit